MPVFIIWCVIIFLIVMINSSNKKKVTKPNTPNMNSGNTTRTQSIHTQNSSQRTTRTTSSVPTKESMAKKKKQLQEHFGMPSGRIHEEIHNDKHVHDENSTLCRANINNDNRQISQDNLSDIAVTGTKEFMESKNVLPDTETLIVCGYNGQEFLDSLQYEFNKKFPV